MKEDMKNKCYICNIDKYTVIILFIIDSLIGLEMDSRITLSRIMSYGITSITFIMFSTKTTLNTMESNNSLLKNSRMMISVGSLLIKLCD